MSDDRFHEIQLGGKQLVFLFMAAAVVAVVVFLAGVMVGRGVRAEKETVTEADAAVASLDAGGAEPGSALVPGAVEGGAGAGAIAAGAKGQGAQAAPDDLSYYAQLEGQTPPAGNAKPVAAEPTTAEPATSEVPAEPAPPPPAIPSTATPAGGEAAGTSAGEWALQVAALRDRAAASAVLRRLVAKRYDAYIVDPPKGSSPPVYRVRVGHFKTRREAEPVMRRLEKDQYKPLITR